MTKTLTLVLLGSSVGAGAGYLLYEALPPADGAEEAVGTTHSGGHYYHSSGRSWWVRPWFGSGWHSSGGGSTGHAAFSSGGFGSSGHSAGA